MPASENQLPPDLPELPNGWTSVPLSQLVDVQRGISYGIVQPGSNTQGGVPIVRVNNLRDHRVVTDDVMAVSPDIEKNYGRTRLRGGEVLLSLVGSLGESAVVPSALRGWNTARAVAVIPVLDDPGAHWVELCLRSPVVQHYIRTWATTTVQATLNLGDVAKLPIPLPTVHERRTIVEVLQALDDKIELNRCMNDTLEALARALFRSWFVDFDPVHTKTEGRQPLGMDVDTAALFPESFQDSLIGKIPKGWRVSPIGEIVHAVGGSTPSTEEPTFWGGEINFCTPKDMASLRSPVLLDTERRITDAGLQQISSGLLPTGTVLLSSRAPIGYLAVTEIPVAVNQGTVAMICDREVPNLYILHWAKESMDTIVANANGTTFLEISKKNFRPILVLLPPPNILRIFMDAVLPLYRRIVNNLSESTTLAQMRDALLPKLISGEIRVKNGDKSL